jgi:hypothetical protein
MVTVHGFTGSRVKRFRVYQKFEPLIREFFLPTRQVCEAGGNGESMRIENNHQPLNPYRKVRN